MSESSKPESGGTSSEYKVQVRYVVSGTVYLYAESEAQARSLAPWEMVCPATCEVVDYDVFSVKRER